MASSSLRLGLAHQGDREIGRFASSPDLPISLFKSSGSDPFAGARDDVYIPAVAEPSHPVSSASAPAPVPGPTETVSRPDPGLARGVWETKPAIFYGAGAIVLVGALLYAASRAGLLRRRPKAGRA